MNAKVQPPILRILTLHLLLLDLDQISTLLTEVINSHKLKSMQESTKDIKEIKVKFHATKDKLLLATTKLETVETMVE